MFKSAGICLLCSVSAEICRDCNEASLASKIEFAGKCTILTYCLPLIKTVFDYRFYSKKHQKYFKKLLQNINVYGIIPLVAEA